MHDPIKIILTDPEMNLAAIVGAWRQLDALKKERQDYSNAPAETKLMSHIDGACGEMAVAKYLDRFWSGHVGEVNTADVGELQVRHSPRHDSRLVIYQNDKDHEVFICVTGVPQMMRIWGWAYGSEGKNPEWLQDPGKRGVPAYFIPHDLLHPMSLSRRLVPRPGTRGVFGVATPSEGKP